MLSYTKSDAAEVRYRESEIKAIHPDPSRSHLEYMSLVPRNTADSDACIPLGVHVASPPGALLTAVHAPSFHGGEKVRDQSMEVEGMEMSMEMIRQLVSVRLKSRGQPESEWRANDGNFFILILILIIIRIGLPGILSVA